MMKPYTDPNKFDFSLRNDRKIATMLQFCFNGAEMAPIVRPLKKLED